MLAETFLSLIPNQTWAIGSGIMIYQNSPAGLAGLVGVMPLSYDRSQILDLGLLKSHIMNELFWSRSAWLIESHWSSCRLPGKTNSSAAARFVDVDNYYVVSASALEERVDLFRVIKGTKERIWGTDADVFRDRWHLLEFQANDDQFTISLDHNWLFTAQDSTLPSDGQIGLWTEEDNVTRFDRIEIETFPASEKRCCRIE